MASSRCWSRPPWRSPASPPCSPSAARHRPKAHRGPADDGRRRPAGSAIDAGPGVGTHEDAVELELAGELAFEIAGQDQPGLEAKRGEAVDLAAKVGLALVERHQGQ